MTAMVEDQNGAMAATCPCCNRENCKVREVRTQATRAEPSRSLGYQGYCPDCDLAFNVKAPQLQIA